MVKLLPSLHEASGFSPEREREGGRGRERERRREGKEERERDRPNNSGHLLLFGMAVHTYDPTTWSCLFSFCSSGIQRCC